MTLVRLCPLELTERQSVLLTNPAYGAHGIKVTNTIRIAISIYKIGDVARPHMHTPNPSRTIISDGGGYTMVEGERICTRRGDLVFTPNRTRSNTRSVVTVCLRTGKSWWSPSH